MSEDSDHPESEAKLPATIQQAEVTAASVPLMSCPH